MTVLHKADGAAIALFGALGWVLQSNDHRDEAVVFAILTAALGALAALVALGVWRMGGHQAPELTASVGHCAPWLLRASLLIALGWVGAWAATEAGVKGAGIAVAASVAVFGVVGEIIKPLKELVDELRPAAFGKSAIGHSYGSQFSVDPGNSEVKVINGRNAVHDEVAEAFDPAGQLTERVTGWGLVARQRRLELIAEGLNATKP